MTMYRYHKYKMCPIHDCPAIVAEMVFRLLKSRIMTRSDKASAKIAVAVTSLSWSVIDIGEYSQEVEPSPFLPCPRGNSLPVRIIPPTVINGTSIIDKYTTFFMSIHLSTEYLRYVEKYLERIEITSETCRVLRDQTIISTFIDVKKLVLMQVLQRYIHFLFHPNMLSGVQLTFFCEVVKGLQKSLNKQQKYTTMYYRGALVQW